MDTARKRDGKIQGNDETTLVSRTGSRLKTSEVPSLEAI